jgi:hypothetical protein
LFVCGLCVLVSACSIWPMVRYSLLTRHANTIRSRQPSLMCVVTLPTLLSTSSQYRIQVRQAFFFYVFYYHSHLFSFRCDDLSLQARHSNAESHTHCVLTQKDSKCSLFASSLYAFACVVCSIPKAIANKANTLQVSLSTAAFMVMALCFSI